jgi:hypothetical protein
LAVDVEKLENALCAVKDDKDGAHLQNRFLSLATHSEINGAEGKRKVELRDPYYFAAQDFNNLLTIALRMDWQKRLWANGDLDDVRWIKFVEADVHLFHVEFRSLFDYLTPIICHVADRPDQVEIEKLSSSASFEKLRNRTLKPKGYANRLGEDLASIVASCDWFEDLREARNALVHQGGTTTAFIDGKDRVLFQVHDRNFRDKILVEEVMYGDGLVDFERYAGLYLGYLLDLLDEVGGAVHRRLGLEDKSDRVKYRHPALDLVRSWILAVSDQGR